MKRYPVIPLFFILLSALFSCGGGHRYYTSANFDQQTSRHKLVAVLPAEMIFTGTQPKKLSPEDITRIQDAESRAFQQALYNSILRYANGRKYFSTINFQDLSSTVKILTENNISADEASKKDDTELAKLLGVDAVVRMRIQKQRYMSDLASYGVDLIRQINRETGFGGSIPGTGIPLPPVSNKTNDIYASCSIVSQGQTLWNDNYKAASNWNNPANMIIENITDNFGRHFPYKQRRS